MKTLFIYLCIAGSALAVGGGAGVIIKREFTEPDRDYSNFDVSIYDVNPTEYIDKVEKYSSKDLAFSALTPVETAIYALEKYKTCENSFSFGYGVTTAPVVTQAIRNAQVKNGNSYFEESLSSSSMVSVGNRYVQLGGKDTDVDLYIADKSTVVISSNESKTGCNYPSKTKSFTFDKFIESYGKQPSEVFNYIVHPLSVKESEKIKEEDGTYTINLEMYPDIATYKYQFQMKMISDLTSRPAFSREHLTIKLDNDLMLKQIIVDENYSASMFGISASLTAHITYEYHPNEYMKIPEMNEKFDYTIGGTR